MQEQCHAGLNIFSYINKLVLLQLPRSRRAHPGVLPEQTPARPAANCPRISDFLSEIPPPYGPEVVDVTCELLMGTGLPLKILTPPQGNPLPEETKRAAREADGVLFGAAGPSTSNVVSWLRWEMSAWAGVWPIRS